jgi:hypothetical protein
MTTLRLSSVVLLVDNELERALLGLMRRSISSLATIHVDQCQRSPGRDAKPGSAVCGAVEPPARPQRTVLTSYTIVLEELSLNFRVRKRVGIYPPS